MRKGVGIGFFICIISFTALLVGLTERVFAISPGPDMQVDYITLDAEDFLIVAISNQGRLVVPEGVGNLSVFVDYVRVAEFDLGDLADQAFRQTGRRTVVHTGVRLAGTLRRVVAFVDSEQEIDEEDEFQNTMSVALNPQPRGGHDLAVTASVDSEDQLSISVANVGSEASPDELAIDCRVYIEEQLQTSFSSLLPVLASGGGVSETLSPPTPIVLAEPTKVRVTCHAAFPPVELDHSNNTFEATLYHVTLDDIDTIYGSLLNNPLISYNMFWIYPTSNGYEKWPASMKDQLREFLLLLEQGKSLPLEGPPPLTEYGGNDYTYLSPEDALTLYLMYVAQSLWFELHNDNWSITDLSSDELAYLFDRRKFFQYLDPPGGARCSFHLRLMGHVTACNPQAIYSFMKHLGMIKSTQEETVFSLVDWIRLHVRHVCCGEDDLENRIENFGYKGYIPVDRITYPLEGKDHISWGCWGTSGFFAAALRTVNIPVIHGRSIITNSFDGSPHEHSRIELPTLRRSSTEGLGIALYHSDDFYNAQLVPWGGGVVPSARLFYTFDEIETLIDNPQDIDCRADGQCNTPHGQATQNNGRFVSLLAREYLPGWYLKKHTVSPETLDEALRGIHAGGVLQEFALPFLSESEREDFLQAAEAEIEALGNGNYNDGVAELLYLSQRAYNRMRPHTEAPPNANHPPHFLRHRDEHVGSCETVTMTLTANDPDGDPVIYTSSTLPAGSNLMDNVFEWNVRENVGLHEVIFHAGGDSGGAAQLDVVIEVMFVEDTQAPAIACPADVSIECDQPTDPSNTGMATATDACDPDPVITFSDMVAPGTCPQELTIARTWTATDAHDNTSSCVQTVQVVDTTPPVIDSNAPATITPPDAPISFTATATDNCDSDLSVEITGYDCYFFTKKGKRIDKTESCVVEISRDNITILDSGGVDDQIEWTISAEDNCGNAAGATHTVSVVNPGNP